MNIVSKHSKRPKEKLSEKLKNSIKIVVSKAVI